MYNDLGKIDGDNAQLGVTRNRDERDVDMSSGKTTYGDHSRMGGIHHDRKSNKISNTLMFSKGTVDHHYKPAPQIYYRLTMSTYGYIL